MARHHETVWSFETARLKVALEIEPEDMDPADSFEFPEDIEAVRSGEVAWFQASVVVYVDGLEVGRDSLGGCAYKTVEEFYQSHRDPDPANRNTLAMKARHTSIGHYFPEMVSIALDEARKTLRQLRAFPLRPTTSA